MSRERQKRENAKKKDMGNMNIDTQSDGRDYTNEKNSMKELEYYFLKASTVMWKILDVEEPDEASNKNSFQDLNLSSGSSGQKGSLSPSFKEDSKSDPQNRSTCCCIG